VKCERCSEAASAGSVLCGRCGRRKTIKTAVAVLVAAEGIFAASFLLLSGTSLPGFAAPRPLASAAHPFVAEAARGWVAFDTAGAYPGTVTHHAMLASALPRDDDKVPELQGITAGTLELNSSAGEGKTVTISFAKVKTRCHDGNCRVRASFDQTQPEVFDCDPRRGAAATVLQVADYDRFTQRLAVSNDLTLVAELGTRHPTVLRFRVAGFDMADNGTRMIIHLAALPPQAGQPYPG
jgi:hypothetical protein